MEFTLTREGACRAGGKFEIHTPKFDCPSATSALLRVLGGKISKRSKCRTE